MHATHAARRPRRSTTTKRKPLLALEHHADANASPERLAPALAIAADAARQMVLAGGLCNSDFESGLTYTTGTVADALFGDVERSQHDDHCSVPQYIASVQAAYLMGLCMGAEHAGLVCALIQAANQPKGGAR